MTEYELLVAILVTLFVYSFASSDKMKAITVNRSSLRKHVEQLDKDVEAYDDIYPGAVAWMLCDNFTFWPVVVKNVFLPFDGVTMVQVQYCGMSVPPVLVRIRDLYSFEGDFPRRVQIHYLSKENELPLFTCAVIESLHVHAKNLGVSVQDVQERLNAPPMWCK